MFRCYQRQNESSALKVFQPIKKADLYVCVQIGFFMKNYNDDQLLFVQLEEIKPAELT